MADSANSILDCLKDLKSFVADQFDQQGREIYALKTALQQQVKEIGDLRREVAAISAAHTGQLQDLEVNDVATTPSTWEPATPPQVATPSSLAAVHCTPSTEPATPQPATPPQVATPRAEDSNVFKLDVNGLLRRAIYEAVAKDNDPKCLNLLLRKAIYTGAAQECLRRAGEEINAPDEDACETGENPKAAKEPPSPDNLWKAQEWPVEPHETWWRAISPFDVRSGARYGREDNNKTGETLQRGEWVKVTHKIGGHRGGADFLKLDDGRGFIFVESRSGVKLFEAHGEAESKDAPISHGQANESTTRIPTWNGRTEELAGWDHKSSNKGNRWEESKRSEWNSWNAAGSDHKWSKNSSNWQRNEPKRHENSWRQNADEGWGNRKWSKSGSSSRSSWQQPKEENITSQKVYMTEADWAQHHAEYEAWRLQQKQKGVQ